MIASWKDISVQGNLSLLKTYFHIKSSWLSKRGIHQASNFSCFNTNQNWREPLLRHLIRHPHERDALAFEYYRYGFFLMTAQKKTGTSENFLTFAQEILVSSASSPFCVLALVNGQSCFDCFIHRYNIFKEEAEQLAFDGLYDRCFSCLKHREIYSTILDIQRGHGTIPLSRLSAKINALGIMAELEKISFLLSNNKEVL